VTRRRPTLASVAVFLAAFTIALAVGAGIGSLALAACGTAPAPDEPPVSATATPPAVPWGDYAPGLQARLNATADCSKLQDEFDAADANNAAELARTGHNNAALMTYIDWLQTRLGCRV
jgi:hypothetical protein